MTTAVLDVGKTNLKLVLVEGDGRVRHSVTTANRPLAGPPYPHADVEAIWGWFLKELAQAPGRAAIAALVPVAHGASAALLAGEELALPVLDYEHAGPDEVGTEYAALVDRFAQSLTPELPQGLNLGRQILWQQRAFPERFAKVTDILPYPQYWAFRLSGRKASEVTSLGCHTHLWRPRERSFGGLVERAGWRPLMPPLRPAFEPLGTIRPELAGATGLDPACRVLCGIHDSNASYLRHRARQAPPFTVVSSGTWVICMAAGGAQDGLDPARDMLANVDVNGDPVPCARFMGGREFALIAGRESGFAGCDAADLGALIEAGVMALPAFGGGSGPFGGRLGEIVPQPPHGPRARAALATLYAALVTDFCLDLLQAQGPLIIEGSFVGNPVFPGLLAALRTEQSVLVSDDATGTAAGAALLARWPSSAPPASRDHGPCAALDLEGLDRYRRAWRERSRTASA